MLNITKVTKTLTGITPKSIPDSVFASSEPIILKGFGDEWPIVKLAKESPQKACNYLESFYNQTPVNVCFGSPENKGRVFYNSDVTSFNYQASKANLSQVFAKLLEHFNDENAPTLYVASTEVNSFLPGFKDQHQTCIDKYNPISSIWIGNESKIAAHYDFPHNLACSVAGTRRFTLFPPDQITNLYPGPMEFAPGGQDISMVDFDNPDFTRFPKFKDAIESAQVAELKTGDALFLPSMWWHHVEGIEPINILLTHWWRDTPAFLGRPNNALLSAMMSLRNLPKEQRKAWQAIFNHYIFEHDNVSLDHIPEHAQGMQKKPIEEVTTRKIRAELIEKLKR